MKVYINGELKGTYSASTGHNYQNLYTELTIGKPNNVNNYYFNGLIDGVQVFTRPLTETEIIVSSVQLDRNAILSSIELDPEIPKLDFRGICYGPYRGVGPEQGEHIYPVNIAEDMTILSALGVNYIRTYGSDGGLENIPKIASLFGITTFIGVWISGILNETENQGQIDEAFSIAAANSVIIVGNEVLAQGGYSLTVSELVDCLEYAQNNKQTNQKIAYADTYGQLNDENFANSIKNYVDCIMVHVYAFHDGSSLSASDTDTTSKFEDGKSKYSGKDAYLAEFGWPSDSTPDYSDCTESKQAQFYAALLELVHEDNIKSFIFDAFDENWKQDVKLGTNYVVGPHWGIFNEDRTAKLAVEEVANWFLD